MAPAMRSCQCGEWFGEAGDDAESDDDDDDDDDDETAGSTAALALADEEEDAVIFYNIDGLTDRRSKEQRIRIHF